MDILVTFDWLRANIGDPDLVVIDCTNFAAWSDQHQMYRTVSGRAHWIDEHIEGSRHADFTSGFCGDTSRFRNTLPSPEAFAWAMAQLGVSNTSKVVLYDDAMSQWASRMWWMLRWIGFDNAAVLDGGWQHWDASGGPVSVAPVSFQPGKLDLRDLPTLRPTLFSTCQDVMAALEDGTTLLIDALSADQFNGTQPVLGLAGHIPGAVNIPGTSLVDPITDCFMPLAQLADRFPKDRTKRTILYCGSGVAASSVALVMTRLGFDDVSIYMPGLQEWMTHADAPFDLPETR